MRLDYFVSFENELTEKHVPYDLRVYVNDRLRIEELGLIDLTHQPITRPIQNTSTRPQRIRIDVKTPCGAFSRVFVFYPSIDPGSIPCFCNIR